MKLFCEKNIIRKICRFLLLIVLVGMVHTYISPLTVYASYDSWVAGSDDYNDIYGTDTELSVDDSNPDQNDVDQEASWYEKLISVSILADAYVVWDFLDLMDMTVDQVILGRLHRNVDNNKYGFELADGNVYGVVGSIGYGVLRNFILGAMGIQYMFMLVITLIKGTSKGRAELKERLTNFIFVFGLLYAIPIVVDIVILLRDGLIHSLISVASQITGNNTISLTSLFIQEAKDTGKIIYAVVAYFACFAGIYLGWNYLKIAIQQTYLFAIFPFVCIKSFYDKQILSKWTSYFIVNLFVPLIDSLGLCLILFEMEVFGNRGMGAQLIALMMFFMIVPSRNFVLQFFGAPVPGSRGMGLAPLLFMALRSGLRNGGKDKGSPDDKPTNGGGNKPAGEEGGNGNGDSGAQKTISAPTSGNGSSSAQDAPENYETYSDGDTNITGGSSGDTVGNDGMDKEELTSEGLSASSVDYDMPYDEDLGGNESDEAIYGENGGELDNVPEIDSNVEEPVTFEEHNMQQPEYLNDSELEMMSDREPSVSADVVESVTLNESNVSSSTLTETSREGALLENGQLVGLSVSVGDNGSFAQSVSNVSQPVTLGNGGTPESVTTVLEKPSVAGQPITAGGFDANKQQDIHTLQQATADSAAIRQQLAGTPHNNIQSADYQGASQRMHRDLVTRERTVKVAETTAKLALGGTLATMGVAATAISGNPTLIASSAVIGGVAGAKTIDGTKAAAPVVKEAVRKGVGAAEKAETNTKMYASNAKKQYQMNEQQKKGAKIQRGNQSKNYKPSNNPKDINRVRGDISVTQKETLDKQAAKKRES